MINTLIKGNLPLLKTVFIAGAVVGAAAAGAVCLGVGYIVGNLTAAKSGEDLRRDLANKMQAFADSFGGNGSASSDHGNGTSGNGTGGNGKHHTEV